MPYCVMIHYVTGTWDPAQNGWTCSSCSRCIANKAGLTQHIKTTHPEVYATLGKPCYKCKMCERTFQKPSGLAKHTAAHLKALGTGNSSAGQASESTMVISSNPGTKAIKINNVRDSWDCPACDTSVKTRSELTNHIRNSHADPSYGNQSTGSLVCPGCTDCKPYANRAGLIAHIKATHPQISPKFETRMKCQLCSDTFEKPIQLAQHITVHTGYKRYSCKDCDYSTSNKQLLLRHESRSHGELQCHECGLQFELETDLNKHMREKHSIDEERTGSRVDSFDQPLDKKGTGRKAGKQYCCRLCDKEYNSRENLQYHMNTHTGSKPYKCQNCDQSFSAKPRLYSHNMRAHGAKVTKKH